MEFLRVVSLRKGRIKPAEFRLRDGESGLSLFARVDQPSPSEVLEAVRAAGKQGDLAAAILAGESLTEMGLALVRTPGCSPNPEVNAIHYEARLPLVRRLWLVIRGHRPLDFFNERLASRICDGARLLE